MSNTNNIVPILRFPQFTDNWERRRFGDIAKKVSIPVEVEPDTFYQQIGIRSHGKGLFHKELVDGKSLGNKRVFWIKENTFIVNIVFAWEQAVAITTNREVGMIASHRFPMYLPVKNETDLKYLLFFFLTKKGKGILELASPGGAGRNKTLGQKEFENVRFHIPKYSEQQKIASFLTAVDDKIQQLQKKKQLLEQYKKGVMQQIFTQQLRFKDDEGKDYPEWEEKKLGEIADIKGGKRLPLGNTLQSENNGYPYITVSDMGNGTVSMRNIRYVPLQVVETIKSYKISTDDIFVSVAGTLGVVGIIPKELNNANLTENANKLTNLKCNQNYLLHYLKSTRFKKFVDSVKTNSAQPKLAIYALNSFNIILPSIPEQKKIAAYLSTLENKLAILEKQIEQSQNFKKGLLQQMFV